MFLCVLLCLSLSYLCLFGYTRVNTHVYKLLKAINIFAHPLHPTSEFTIVMPTLPISHTLINLHKCNGTPWQWPAWQNLTGIHHGLFLNDDALLPNNLTCKDILEIK